MELVIKLSDDVYTRLFDNGTETSWSDRMDIEIAIRRGIPIAFNADIKPPAERQVRRATSRQRLIDFNEIRFLLEPIAPLKKGDKVHYELVAFGNQILEIPKVDAVPIEELQSIRNELTKQYEDSYNRRAYENSTVPLLKVLDLIDAVIGKPVDEPDAPVDEPDAPVDEPVD